MHRTILWLALVLLVQTAWGAAYNTELFTTIQVNQGSGSVKSDANEKKIKSNVIDAKFSFGYFIDEVMEPVLEYSLRSSDGTLGTFKSKINQTSWGIGSIFNLNNAAPTSKKKVEFKSIWIPYGGFIIQSNSSKIQAGSGSQSVLQDSRMSNKLVLGLRYLLYDHIAINNWIRVSYDKQTGSAQEGTKEEGSKSELNLEFCLFGLSLLF